MILVFDVGNTETTVGLYDGTTLDAHWRVMTDVNRTPDEVALQLRALLAAAGRPLERVTGVAIGSVVPSMTGTLSEACASLTGIDPVEVDARSPLPIRLEVEEPLTVGADRILNTLAASRLYGVDTIVVDLGTATTYDCITAGGVFLGGVIAPGVRTSAETLFRKTSKLPATELVAPERVIGRRTEECIRAGVVYGNAEAIDGIVRRIKAAWPADAGDGSGDRVTDGAPLVVATGGLARTFREHCREIDRVEPHLTLEGLRLAHELIGGA